MAEEFELVCDTINDTNTYYVIDPNLGIEHEIHGAIQFKIVDKEGYITYKSGITTISKFIKELKLREEEESYKILKEFMDAFIEAIKNNTRSFFIDGKLRSCSEILGKDYIQPNE